LLKEEEEEEEEEACSRHDMQKWSRPPHRKPRWCWRNEDRIMVYKKRHFKIWTHDLSYYNRTLDRQALHTIASRRYGILLRTFDPIKTV
jgi:hypothetical protein